MVEGVSLPFNPVYLANMQITLTYKSEADDIGEKNILTFLESF